MVTLRGRCGGAADRRQRRPAKGPETPPRPAAETRRRTPGLSNGFNAEDGEQSHTEEEAVKPAKRTVTRKSRRLRNPSGGRRSGLRRSTRPTKPTSRYLASKKFVGFGTDTAGPVLKRMDNMKRTRRLSKDGKIFSKAQKSRTPQRELSDIEEEEGAATDADVRQEAAEDGDCSADPVCDAKVSRASSLYQGPSSDLLRGTFRIGASGPNTTRRGGFRPTKTVWSNQSDEDDSDEEEGKVPGSCRSLGLNVPAIRKDKMAAGAGLADIDPMVVDRSVGFDSIGGLSGHISALKEMVVFPLLYPEVFDNFKIQPPRGCLFYGPPGTGKTLVARALANECSHGNRKVAFFMRKGADCLSKWVGESERQLRLLFEQAYQMRPSIIFFDEIDGLAPVRSSRQDQIHSSIVSTLLALMDGLASRGEVVVIGATNRLDSIDPALRRPGRFDREFLFGLPDRESRREILLIHTRQWKPAPSEDFVDELAEKCVGYCGADIRAVCTEAALCALRRRYPQIYGTSQKLLLDISSIAVGSRDFVAAMAKMSPAAQRSAASPAKPLSPVVQPLLGAALGHILGALHRLFPHAEQGIKRRREEDDLTSGLLDDGQDEGSASSSILAPFNSKSKNFLHFASSAVKQPTSHRPRMLLAGRPGAGQTSHLAPAILHSLERFTVHSLDSAVLFGASCTSPEEACAQLFLEARRTSPSILYVPHVHQWWDAAGSALRASFLSLLGSIPSFSPILLLATCDVPHQALDPEIQSLFREEYGEIHAIRAATKQERLVFFQDLILNQAAEAPPPVRRPRAVEVLPVAPPPPLRQPSERERLLLERREEDALRELRLFLRDVTERLSLDRRFRAFCRPVDVEEVPDYLEVVQHPMDFSTLLTNVDRHVYGTVGEFVADADLIWKNALDYNPDRDPIDRNIRHRACALKDTVQAIIRDELDEDFERFCEEIRECRNRRALSCLAAADPEEVCSSLFSSFSPGRRPLKKKRYKRPRKSKWSTGIIPKPKKKPPLTPSSSSSSPSSSSSSSLSSSSMSSMSTSDWSSDVEPSRPNGFRRGSNGESGGGAVNGHHPRRKLRPRPHLTSKTNGVGGNKLERHSERDTSAELPDDLPRPRPVVNGNRLKDLLNRAVTRTDGAEVEPLEKLYALLAQCIYRHRDNYDKTELLQEMKSEINSFS